MTDDIHPQVRPVKYYVSLLPEDFESAYLWTITVQYRREGKWAVYLGAYESNSLPCCLGKDGKWGYEGSEEREDEEYLATHRFSLDEALELAKEQAGKIAVLSHYHKRSLTALEALELDRQEKGEIGK